MKLQKKLINLGTGSLGLIIPNQIVEEYKLTSETVVLVDVNDGIITIELKGAQNDSNTETTN